MRRYWIEEDKLNSGEVRLDGESFHHIVDVCRQTLGSKFEVITQGGQAHLVEIFDLQKKSALARVISSRMLPSPRAPYIDLYLSLPKLATFEMILEKSVELGVRQIWPFCSEFSFFRKPSMISRERRERWSKIVQSATQQSGRGDLMLVAECSRFEDLVAKLAPHHCLVAYEGEAKSSLKGLLQSKRKSGTAEKCSPEIWNLLVGSEGGFSKHEIDQLNARGFEPFTLGSQVLRVETACISLVAALKYEFDLFDSAEGDCL